MDEICVRIDYYFCHQVQGHFTNVSWTLTVVIFHTYKIWKNKENYSKRKSLDHIIEEHLIFTLFFHCSTFSNGSFINAQAISFQFYFDFLLYFFYIFLPQCTRPNCRDPIEFFAHLQCVHLAFYYFSNKIS